MMQAAGVTHIQLVRVHMQMQDRELFWCSSFFAYVFAWAVIHRRWYTRFCPPD
jgi:hypothetical protein